MQDKKISTKEFVNLLINNKKNYFEVFLSNGYFNATHFITFGGKKIYDTGIDSKDVKWTIEEFINFYPYAFWKIDQIINKFR